MHSLRSSAAIFLFALLLALPVFVHAEGTESDQECAPFFQKCPCNQVPDKTDPNKCVTGTEKNAKGYSNVNQCPPGVCIDKTNGKVTKGICPTEKKCKAVETAEGEKPQTCDQAGSCKGPNAPEKKPGEGEKGGQPPQLPQMPQGGGGGESKPQPNTGQSGTSTKEGLLRGDGGFASPVPNYDPTSQWQPYTKAEKDPFTTGIDTVTARQNNIAPRAEEEKTIESAEPVQVDLSNQRELEAKPIQRFEQKEVNIRDERYENPPRNDATGFVSPEEQKRFADNQRRDVPDYRNSDVRMDTNPDTRVQLKSLIPALMEKLRDLLQKLLIQLGREKFEQVAKPPVETLPWGRISMLPKGEIKRLEKFPPSRLIPVLQSELVPETKPFETYAYVVCDPEFDSCITFLANGEGATIPGLLTRQVEQRVIAELPKFPESKYLINAHDHPISAVKRVFKEKFPDMDVSIPLPKQLLTGPASPGDISVISRQKPDLNSDPRYEMTAMVIDPAGIWVGSWGPESIINNGGGHDYEVLRRELIEASQSGDDGRRDAAIQNLIKGAKGLMNMSIEFLPSNATNKQIGEAAVRTRQNR